MPREPRLLPPKSMLRREGPGIPTAQALPPSSAASPHADPGRPRPKMPVPHVYTFATVWNNFSKSYRWKSDEALRDDWEDALKVRKDPLIAELLFKRKCPVVSEQWHIEPDNPSNPNQQAVCAEMTKMVQAIPNFQHYRNAIEERVFFGKAGVQQTWGAVKIGGSKRITVSEHTPVNGDKIRWGWDKTPGIQVNPAFVPERHNRLVWDDRGACLYLTDPYYRDSFAIGKFQPTDLDFYHEADMGGAAMGLGLRNFLYWPWYLRCETLKWLGEAIQRFGLNGVWVGFFEQGNAESEKAIMEGLAMIANENMAAFPRAPGQEADQIFQNIAPAGIQYEVMQALMEYLDGWMRLVVVGQALSGETGSTGMGSGVAELQGTTFEQIVRFDSIDHEEIITNELLKPMIRMNRWELPFSVRFRLGTNRKDRADRMEAIQGLNQLGLPIDAEEAYDAANMSPPKDAANEIPGQDPNARDSYGRPIGGGSVNGRAPNAVNGRAPMPGGNGVPRSSGIPKTFDMGKAMSAGLAGAGTDGASLGGGPGGGPAGGSNGLAGGLAPVQAPPAPHQTPKGCGSALAAVPPNCAQSLASGGKIDQSCAPSLAAIPPGCLPGPQAGQGGGGGSSFGARGPGAQARLDRLIRTCRGKGCVSHLRALQRRTHI